MEYLTFESDPATIILYNRRYYILPTGRLWRPYLSLAIPPIKPISPVHVLNGYHSCPSRHTRIWGTRTRYQPYSECTGQGRKRGNEIRGNI